MDIQKSITVRKPVDLTFTAFTAEISRWWPLKEFSFGGEKAKELHLECYAGGRFYERFQDGEEFVIGMVTAFDAPNRVAFTWKQGEGNSPTEVEVRFSAVPEGTRVVLEHRGWEATDSAADMARRFDQGWDWIINLFGQFVDG